MNDLQINTNSEVEAVFNNYPKHIREKLSYLRKLILETAQEIESIKSIEETLKWGEPAYLTKNGSTLRINWKEKMPDQYAMYFKCTSKLVPRFKSAFDNKFEYEGTRAIIFDLEEKIPINELKQCIKAALEYHSVKHLPTLGIHH